MTGSDVPFKTMQADLIAMIPRLRRFGYALTGSQDEADDLTQIALERALSRWRQWTPGTRLESWVFRIAHNAWIDEVRARKRRGPHVDLDDTFDVIDDDGRTRTEARLDLAQVRDVIAALPEDQRLVLALVAVDGLSYLEASEVLGIPIGTVMSRLSRARKAIATRLKHSEGLASGGLNGD